MKKNILLAIALLAIFIFIPIIKVNATSVYVGVQISRATAPGCVAGTAQCGTSYSTYTGYMTNPNWCLPGGYQSIPNNQYYGTQMAITKSDACSYANNNDTASNVCYYCANYAGISNYCIPATAPSINPVITTSASCPGGNTIWSGLLNLTSGTGYKVYLYTPSFCSGYYSNSGLCLETDHTGENCCDVCAHYGQTVYNYNNDYGATCPTSSYCYSNVDNSDTTCSTIAALKGSPCLTCTNAATYDWYDASGNCNYSNGYNSCGPAPAGITRVCACNVPTYPATGFLFPFTY